MSMLKKIKILGCWTIMDTVHFRCYFTISPFSVWV